MIALSQTLDTETWVEAAEDGLKIHASRHWLAPLLNEFQRDLSSDIYYPMKQLEPSLLHLALILHKETYHSAAETSTYALAIARVLSIHVLRTHY